MTTFKFLSYIYGNLDRNIHWDLTFLTSWILLFLENSTIDAMDSEEVVVIAELSYMFQSKYLTSRSKVRKDIERNGLKHFEFPPKLTCECIMLCYGEKPNEDV